MTDSQITEVDREIIDGKVHVKYSDGTAKVFDIPDTPPTDLVVDVESVPDAKGHKFTKAELKAGGYND